MLSSVEREGDGSENPVGVACDEGRDDGREEPE